MMNDGSIKALRISLASPKQILAHSYGEVTRAETINYLTQKPEPGGLFCERIFGPIKDWCCACGKYKRERTPGLRCEKCGVEVTRSSTRRERLGHITLAAPVAHSWFARSAPSIIALLLDLSTRSLGTLLSYSAYLVLDIAEEERTTLLAHLDAKDARRDDLAALAVGDLLDVAQYRTLCALAGTVFTAASGAEAVRARLEALDLDSLAADLRAMILSDPAHAKKAMKQLHLVEAFRASGIAPAWMIFEVLPVLPPELRPLVPLGGGRYATSDVNALYERVIHRNNRIKKFISKDAPDLILNQEKRLLQDACDALFDNARRKHPVIGSHKQPLKSLTDILKGKEGRFRRNLLGKRVDYSGRSVIVGDTSLKLHQCGLPTKICLELFKPFLIRMLVERHHAPNAHVAKRMIERTRKPDPVIWDVLAEVLIGKVVLLNRAPTLHRLSIQAFEVVWMSDSNAIRLHPCVCSAFNADFDGDQMAVHLPLSDASQAEARALMLSTRNLRSPASGEPAVSISQEMVLGLFYLTQARPSSKGSGRLFADADDALCALDHGIIDLHTSIVVRLGTHTLYEAPDTRSVLPPNKRVPTTAGRLIFNQLLPEALQYKNYEMTKERLKLLVAESLRVCGEQATARMVDALKRAGFTYATRSGISFSVLSDIAVPPAKHELLAQADTHILEIAEQAQLGMISAEEADQQRIAVWQATTDAISSRLEAALDQWGALATIIKSGATKAKFQQIRQLSGMRGLMARPSGEIIVIPIRGNYLEGLTVRETFIAASAARNGFMGRSLNTATTGYLTRKLVEAGMEVWITMPDCGTSESVCITQEDSLALGLPNMQSRIVGRMLAEDVAGLRAGTLLDDTQAAHLVAQAIPAVRVRSVLACQATYGVCQHCYGSDLARGTLVRLGTAVGIIAGQSIGEPGTQLSMRAFHSGGIANAAGDIRAGLPRVIELFEGRTPPQPAPLAPFAGIMHVEKDTGEVTLRLSAPTETWSVTLPAGQQVLVHDGESVEMGTQLAHGACDPQTLIATRGRAGAARYLIDEVQRVFRGTGVYISEKHIECIVRQMLRYVLVRDPGDTTLLPGDIADRFTTLEMNAQVLAQGGTPAVAQPILLGLTRTVLQTRSFLAAASFQETSRVLMRAAIGGREDPIRGYKEQLVIGGRIPTPRDGERTARRVA
ncbi:DNA-directed RNA polymerase subunit beta' [Reticulibacter mediterranei]|uniref:DNA-directed RNA polymerase subunit n=1 Tax=Reticulibacter mediterranei TaxID=2778369 RepID=A0A8J3J3A4_9CHLR|nr:DNA-directed RNA polymerase subunit beta' [Reticulibacter mediterranei]GHP00772.1 DNA-directed RNA polymerase subunit beta' [Reticulibacter mediterranei]